MRRFAKSLSHALSGLQLAFRSERNFRIHIISMIVVVLAGVYLKLTLTSWSLVIISIGFVLAAELFNTAVERLGDEIASGKQKLLIKYSKDLAAAAVFISALSALIIGILVLIIPLIKKLLA